MALAEAGFAETGVKQRRFADLTYGARSWDRERRAIARIEHGPRGANPRFVATDLAGDGRDLYERLHCARGEMENPHRGTAAPALRRPHLVPPMVAQPVPPAARQPRLHPAQRDPTVRPPGAPGMARAQGATIRLKLLKIGAAIVRNTRRVRFHLSSACPVQDLFRLVAARLEPG